MYKYMGLACFVQPHCTARTDMGLSENWGTLFGGPYNKDPTIEGTILGSPIIGNPHMLDSGNQGAATSVLVALKSSPGPFEDSRLERHRHSTSATTKPRVLI